MDISERFPVLNCNKNGRVFSNFKIYAVKVLLMDCNGTLIKVLPIQFTARNFIAELSLEHNLCLP